MQPFKHVIKLQNQNNLNSSLFYSNHHYSTSKIVLFYNYLLENLTPLYFYNYLIIKKKLII